MRRCLASSAECLESPCQDPDPLCQAPSEVNVTASPPREVSSNGYAYDGPPYNAGSSDILGKLTIEEDGLYRLQLSDLFGGTRNEPGHVYRLVIRRAAPDFALVAWALHMEIIGQSECILV